MSEKKRIKNGQRATWRTYPNAPSTPEYEGIVVAFLPKGESPADVLRAAGVGGLGRLAIQHQVGPGISERDRYLVRCNKDQHRAPSATTLERANPTAEREP